MTTSYVNATGSHLDWTESVVDGRATLDIFEIVGSGDTTSTTLWAADGASVTSTQVSTAEAAAAPSGSTTAVSAALSVALEEAAPPLPGVRILPSTATTNLIRGVKNVGTEEVLVQPAGTDTIDGDNVPVAVAPGTTAQFRRSGTGTWVQVWAYSASTGSTPTVDYVRITTTGSSFSPTVELATSSTATVTWTVEETSATSTGVSPTISFGSTATRHVRMTVKNGSTDAMADVVTFNLGFTHTDDAGTYSIGSTYDKTAQAVSGVENVSLMTGLVRFCAANISTLVGAISFAGMSSLQYIECFGSRLTGVTLTGCTSLIRLCVEQNNISSLDLNPVAANLKDLRAAAMQGGTLAFTTLTANLAQLYHFCVRDQTVTGMPAASRLPVIEQLWIWNTGQSGTLTVSSSVASDVRAYSNSYTAATLTGCSALNVIDLSSNSLTQTAVDSVLTTVNGFSTSSGALDVSGGANAAPSSTGTTARTSLLGRSWTVTVTSAGAGVHSDDFTRSNATGLTNVGNGWTTPGSANANIVSNDLVRTDSGSYQVLVNPGGQDLPANYSVTTSIPAASIGNYFGLVGRWNGTQGVAAFFDAGSNFSNLKIRDAASYAQNDVTVTADNAFPSTWSSSSSGDHTFTMKMSGTTIEVYLDGTLVAHGTKSTNSTATGTGYGVCGEGGSRVFHSIGTTQP